MFEELFKNFINDGIMVKTDRYWVSLGGRGNDIYKVKKMSYDKLTKKQEFLKEQISSYNEENIDISDLYDRLESK